jgi:hypothetical protein
MTKMARAAFNKKKILFANKCELNLRKKLVSCYIWSIALYGTETWTFQKTVQKYLKSSEIWARERCRRSAGPTENVRNKSVTKRHEGDEHPT